jgi:hypothetical protein
MFAPTSDLAGHGVEQCICYPTFILVLGGSSIVPTVVRHERERFDAIAAFGAFLR